jgi:putative peptide zinc metalloprotease protein
MTPAITSAATPAPADLGRAPPLPPLREELQLCPGPRQAGQPGWTLHDPVRHQFFQLDWPSVEILRRWHLPDAADIVAAVNDKTTLSLTLADVEQLRDFLQANQLLALAPGQARALAERRQRQQGGLAAWLLHHYLFFRVPLLRPDAALAWLAPRLAGLFSRTFLWLTLAAGGLGLASVLRDGPAFSATLVDLFTWQGLAAYGLTLIGVKALHELAHGLTAKRFGCRVPTMGVALMVLWPVAYTDTTEVWKLPSHRQRMAVAGAGICAELAIAAWATLAWAWLPQGGPKTAAFLLSTTTWVTTLLVNASPFMRFDGYFVLCDAVRLPNLHSRAFAVARWHLRERLFALGEPAPEPLSRRRTAALVGFAWLTWLYRLSLFLGIAFLVYSFFIKAVGLLLFAVELGWFIAFPVWSELRQWWLRRARISRRRRLALGLPLLVLGAVVGLPLPVKVTGTGLLQPREQMTLYAPAGARVVALPHRHGEAVQAGEVLFDIESPELTLRSRQATARAAELKGQMAASAFDSEQRRQWQVASEQWGTNQAQAQTVAADAQRYAPQAPFAGVFYDLDPELQAGDWVGQNEVLGRLVATGPRQVVTYVDEQEVKRIAVGDEGLFLVDALRGPLLRLRVQAIERDASRVLKEKLLASHLGGQVLVRPQGDAFYPDAAVFRVTLEVLSGTDHAEQSWRGLVAISARPEPLARRLANSLLSVFWREAGF